VAQALADVSTIAILQERVTRSRETLATQLQSALNSRIIIEQAKGVLAERDSLEMRTAFERLRHAARSSNRRLADVANDVDRRPPRPDPAIGTARHATDAPAVGISGHTLVYATTTVEGAAVCAGQKGADARARTENLPITRRMLTIDTGSLQASGLRLRPPPAVSNTTGKRHFVSRPVSRATSSPPLHRHAPPSQSAQHRQERISHVQWPPGGTITARIVLWVAEFGSR